MADCGLWPHLRQFRLSRLRAGKVKSARQRYYAELEKEATLRRVLADAELGLDPMVVLSAMTESAVR